MNLADAVINFEKHLLAATQELKEAVGAVPPVGEPGCCRNVRKIDPDWLLEQIEKCEANATISAPEPCMTNPCFDETGNPTKEYWEMREEKELFIAGKALDLSSRIGTNPKNIYNELLAFSELCRRVWE